MGSVQDDACDTVLVLGLSYDGSPPPKHHESKKEPRGDKTEPSLTLALSDEAFLKKIAMREAASDEQSAGSSFSIVKEEIEVEWQRNADDDDEGGVRKKLRLTKEQSALLENRFKEHSTLNPKQKMALAKQLNLRPRQVEVWFQNRRARTKLKQTEVDCEFLKRCCETLADENRRLHRELQELKAIKLAPLYMQVPSAASITMCPSCERISADGSSKAQKAHLYPQFTRAPSAAC